MKTLTVNVTQAHITAGWPGSSRRCPIALALIEALAFHYPFQPVVEVGVFGFSIFNPGDETDSTTVFLPYIAAWFIEQIDSGLPVTPITFEITLP